MFRYLIAYSRDKMAKGMSPRYKRKNKKLLKTLTLCLEDAKPMEIFFTGKMGCVNYVC